MNQRDLISVPYLKQVSLVFLLICWACSSVQNEPENFDRESVAIVGKDTITVGQFKLSYETAMLKTADTDNIETRRFHLNQMIDGYLLAHEAINGGFDTTSVFKRNRELLYREVMRDFQYGQITGDIDVEEDDLISAFHRSQESRLVRRLCSKDKYKLFEWYHSIQYGDEDFYSLARSAFSDKRLQQNGGLIGWISWGDTDLKFENVVYTTEKGIVSKPFQSVNGWHIIKIEEIRRNLIVSEIDFERFKSKNRNKLLRIYKQDKLSDYLSEFMQDQELKLNVPLTKQIAFEIRDVYRAMIGPDDVELSRLPGSSIESIELRLGDLLDETLVSSKDRIWTVRDFIRQIPELPARFIFQEFDKAVAFAVRNDILAEEAYQEGLDQVSEIRERVLLRSYDYLARIQTERMIQSIPLEKRPNFTEEDSQLYRLQQWRKSRQEFLNKAKKETAIVVDYDKLEKVRFN